MKSNIKVNKIKLTKTILFISIITCLIIMFISNNKRIEKMRAIGSTQAISVTANEPNTSNFDYVESLDHRQVPVPKGYTASSVEDERYVNGVTEEEKWYLQENLTYKDNVNYYLQEELSFDSTTYYEKEELGLSSEGTYPWTKNTSNIWSSGNKGKRSTTSTLSTGEFTVTESQEVVNIIWSVSSHNTYGLLKAVATNVSTGATITTQKFSGTIYGTSEASLTYFNTALKLTPGTYTLDITYTKGNSTSSSGLDKGYVKSVKQYTPTSNGNAELKVGNEVSYPWTYNNDLGVWKSGNQGAHNTTSTLKTNSFTVGSTGGFIRINWSIRSQATYDYMKATIKDASTLATIATTSNYSGTNFGSTETGLTYFNSDVKVNSGTYIVEITYTKNGSTNTGFDTAYLKNIKLYTQEANANEQITMSENVDYVWTKNASNIWVSGNKNMPDSSSTLVSNNFTVAEQALVRINFSFCSENVNDYVKAVITNTTTNETYETEEYSGTMLGSQENSLVYLNIEEKVPAGTYKVEVKYTKNASTNGGTDSAYIKNIGVYTKTVSGEEITYYNRTHSGGFVIYEGIDSVTDANLWDSQITRNQYVWIPIDEEELANMYTPSGNMLYGNYYDFTVTGYNKKTVTSSNYREPKLVTSYDYDQTYLKQYMGGITRYEFKQEMEQRFYEMLESIATYGGFYIGRYETGDLSKNMPKVVRMNADIHTVTWCKMYQRSKRLRGANSTVETNLIWGIQYDEVLKWLIDTKEKTAFEVRGDSTSWGNYTNSTFSYYTNTSKGTGTKSKGSNTRTSSGAAEYTKANNIYDLAGNVDDWTMESYGSNYRYYRGGAYDNYGVNGPAYNRNGYYPYVSLNVFGARSVLYIK